MITNTSAVEITGLAELAADLPDDRWYEMRVRLRKSGDGAEVLVDPDIRLVTAHRRGCLCGECV